MLIYILPVSSDIFQKSESEMYKKKLTLASLFTLLAVLLTFGIASAHTTVHAGNYEIEVGWTDEPPVVGQRTAIVMNVSDTTATDSEVDISKLVVNVAYGGQTKTLTLQPVSEDAKNEYIAPLLPTIPGQYTIQLRGQIGAKNIDINEDVQPEEVTTSDVLAFPNTPNKGDSNNASTLNTWLFIGALLVAIAALILSILALRKSRS
jgi:hypothetical protein